MSRILNTAAALAAVIVTVSSCNDSTVAPSRVAPRAALSVTAVTDLNQTITALIQQIYPEGLRTAASTRWDNVTAKLDAARAEPEQQAQQAVVARSMLANLVQWIQSNTSDVIPPEGETQEHVVARLVLYMSVYTYGDPAAPLPSVPQMGSDATLTLVDPNAATTLVTPENKAGISLPAGAVGEPTVLVIYEDADQTRPPCSGPLDTSLCQYPRFYHFDIFPHERLLQPARVGVCHITTGLGAPLRDEEHDGRLRVAHDAPSDQADFVSGSTHVEGIEILPLTDISDFLMCGQTGIASAQVNAHSGNSLADRGWRALGMVASAAKWLVVPKTAYAIDQGGGGTTLEFSTFEVVDPLSNDAPPPADATAPVVTPVVSGTSSNGWYTTDVGVSWSVTDAESGIASSTGCGAVSVTVDTNGNNYTCSATNGAGLSNSGSVTIKRDATPPAIAASVTGALSASGWYTDDVHVSWSVSDVTSGVASSLGCSNSTVSEDTQGTTFSCAATDNAGNSNTASKFVRRDATPPVIGYSGNAGTYTVDQTIAITCAASDATSGLDSSTCVNVGGDAYTFPLGGHSYLASASDNAGNTNQASTSFQVFVTPASLCALTRRFTSSAGVATSLCAKLDAYASSIARGSSGSAAGQIGAYVNQIQAQTGKTISVPNAAILISLAHAL